MDIENKPKKKPDFISETVPIAKFGDIYIYPPNYKEKNIDMTDKYIFTKEECDRLFFYSNHFRMDIHNNLSELDTRIFKKLFKITHGNYNIMENENI